MIIQAKSKTFLVGEYAVTCGGSAIVLCTSPSFKLRVKRNRSSCVRGIENTSPAFQFYRENQEVFRNLFIKFRDPYHKTGGFGASSAQFAMLYKLYREIVQKDAISIEQQQISQSRLYQPQEIDDFLAVYRKFAGKSSVIQPSGADCLAQFNNEHIYFNNATNSVERMNWDFDDIDFVILKTRQKLATHKHLRELSKDFIREITPQLTKIVENVKKAWDYRQSADFAEHIMRFYHASDGVGLVSPFTKEIVDEITQIDGVLAAKGCGAMGADTIIVIIKKRFKEKILKKICKKEQLQKKLTKYLHL